MVRSSTVTGETLRATGARGPHATANAARLCFHTTDIENHISRELVRSAGGDSGRCSIKEASERDRSAPHAREAALLGVKNSGLKSHRPFNICHRHSTTLYIWISHGV